jgi:hypothetical protein
VDASILYRLLQCFAGDYTSKQSASCFRNVLLDGEPVDIAVPPGYPNAWLVPRQGHLTCDFVSYHSPPQLQSSMPNDAFRFLISQVRHLRGLTR